MTWPFVPEWVDRRSAEWCAELCERIEARLMTVDGKRGARACAFAIRGVVAAGKPALPVPAHQIGDVE